MVIFQSGLLLFFYFFAAIAIWLGVVSLRGGMRFVRYLQAELTTDLPDFMPFASIFVPCRGVDQGLKENINALFAQNYPLFELIFVSDRSDDPAFAIIENARRSFMGAAGPTMRFVVAGAATDSGQKVHNLRVAVQAAHPKSEVFVFVDTDAHPQPFWLRSLVAPLSDESTGAGTGYRWFVPTRNNFASHLLSVWNASIASALGEAGRKNFCWGGSTAIRRETFERLGIAELWRGTVSDDFTVTRALHDAHLQVKFVPQCLTPSFENCSLSELVEFTVRQLKITRVYAPHLWKGVLMGSFVFVIAFFDGIALVIERAIVGLSFITPLVLLLIMLALGAMKSHLRLRAVSLAIPDTRVRSWPATFAHMTLWPAASLLYLFDALAAAVSRRITWRGTTYELKSPTETVIIRGDSYCSTPSPVGRGLGRGS